MDDSKTYYEYLNHYYKLINNISKAYIWTNRHTNSLQ